MARSWSTTRWRARCVPKRPGFSTPRHGAHGVEATREHALATLESVKAALPEGFDVTAVVADGATIEAAVEELDWQDGDLLMLGSSGSLPRADCSSARGRQDHANAARADDGDAGRGALI